MRRPPRATTLDDEVFGFKTESSANIKIVFVAKQSANNDETVDMSGGWSGSIELNDFQIVIDSDEDDSDRVPRPTRQK